MRFARSSGVLLHVSSLPSYGGIGDLGPAAHAFLDFLAAAKQHVWQVLPLCPTGFGNSPYAGLSAFAGNPSLISLEYLCDWGWLAGERIAGLAGHNGNVDFNEVEKKKLPLLFEAAKNFLERGKQDTILTEQWVRYQEFCRIEAEWLEDYALYAELRRQQNTGAWLEWPEPLRRRDQSALKEVIARHGQSIEQEKVLQFAFAEQWKHLKEAAVQRAIRILGDVAIFVSMDSADVWVHPELFDLKEDLRPTHIAGVPPDYFSPTGQRWGNPLYDWETMERQGFHWWIERIRHACHLCDIVRLDHFRGFEACWSIPAEDETAVNGEWVKVPGAKLFAAMESALGKLPLIAEDLGMITPEVDALRHAVGFPGMKVLQFGFGGLSPHTHLPHHFTPDTVVYTGTHDNDTTKGWWQSTSGAERAEIEAYLGAKTNGDTAASALIRAAEGSVAQIAMIPMQDLLELGSEARMNTPAVSNGNWSWRVAEGSWTPQLTEKLAALVKISDRDFDPLASNADPTTV